MHPFEIILSEIKNGYRQKTAYSCGPASVALAAKALQLKSLPESAWTSEQVKQWISLDQFSNRGMALHEIQFITEFLYASELEVNLNRAFPGNQNRFISHLEILAEQENLAIVVNFSQHYLLGRPIIALGGPHYAVVAGYNSITQKVLIADVDTEIKEPYTVSVDRLFKSMSFLNTFFGVPRGWLLLRKLLKSS